MSTKELPSPELLRQLLRYDPDTGKLYWRKRLNPENNNAKNTWNKRWANNLALDYIDPTNGYRIGKLMGRKVYAHRIIWAMHSNKYPREVDHINGDRADNRITNLRACTRSENCKNLRIPIDNTSGYIGVGRKGKGWRARIFDIHLGTFESLEDAIAARKEAEAKYGFHPNHGRS
jgi:hypothetical protein